VKTVGQSRLGKAGDIARKATRDAAEAILADPAKAGKRAKAVIITPTDTPAEVGEAIRTALEPGRGRKVPASATPPEHVRGFPGAAGTAARGLVGLGTALSAAGLAQDIAKGDVPMAVGNALSTSGGILEGLAVARAGAAVAGVSAVTGGLVTGGAGIAITESVSSYRAFQAGDVVGGVASALGAASGASIAIGAVGTAAGVAGAPALLAGGLVAGLAVGAFQLGRYVGRRFQ
jgi:hypothetical protein